MYFTSAAVWLINLPLFLIILIATLASVAIFLHFATNPNVPCPTKDCTRYSEVVECSTSPILTLKELLQRTAMLKKNITFEITANRLNYWLELVILQSQDLPFIIKGALLTLCISKITEKIVQKL